MTSVSREHLTTVLQGLPDDYVLSSPTLSPVIPTGKHAVIYHLVQATPAAGMSAYYRDGSWVIALVSPLTASDAAIVGLEEALDGLLEVLEAEPTLRWTAATFEPYNERLWCFSVEVQLFNEIVPDEETPDLGGMTVTALKDYAAEKGIPLGGARLKADIVSAIETGLE